MKIFGFKALLSGALIAGAFLVHAIPATAHHSGAMWDREKEVKITGTVKEFQYTNPHSWLIVEVTNEDGTTTEWGFESEGPTTLMRAGIPKSALPPGTKVTVTAHPMKDGRSAGSWVSLEKEDGTVLVPRPGE